MKADFQLAVLSDIHGNRWALDTVLADIRRRHIARIVNLGDCLYGPLDPAGTADLLTELDIPTVCGNEDRIIYESDAAASPTLDYVRASLNRRHLEWLRELPATMTVFDDCYLCHGTPESDSAYLLTRVTERGLRARTDAEIEDMVSPIDAPVILCGHDHTSGMRRLPNGQLIVNPGSVGLQAYQDELPHPHVVQAGDPKARYCILTFTAKAWNAEFIGLTYTHQPAVEAAQGNGRPDWARWLESGRV